MDADAVLFADLTALTSNAQHVLVLQAEVEDGLKVTHHLIVATGVEGEGSLVVLCQGNDIIDATVGSGVDRKSVV